MKNRKVNIMPKTENYLNVLGEQIKFARRRRKLSILLIAERAGISRQTVSKIEKGDSSVSLGSYAAVLHALDGMDKDLTLIAKKDTLGRQLQDMNL